MHPSVGPYVAFESNPEITVYKTVVMPGGVYPADRDDAEQVIVVQGPALIMIVPQNGHGRLARPYCSQTPGQPIRYVLINNRTYHIATPFSRKLSDLVSLYEDAVESLPKPA